MVNPKNKLDQITLSDLKKIWSPDSQQSVLKWTDINPEWMTKKISLFGAGSDSGTFDYFTEAIVGKAKSSRSDYTASEDDNIIVKGVAADEGALGYLPYAYYVENKTELKALAIENKYGKFIVPSESTVQDGTYSPLSRPLFIYVNAKSLENKSIQIFLEFYIKSAKLIVNEVKSIPFSEAAYNQILVNLKNQKKGTVFNGHTQIGLSVQDLLKKESVK